jgi:hypothetical protein
MFGNDVIFSVVFGLFFMLISGSIVKEFRAKLQGTVVEAPLVGKFGKIEGLPPGAEENNRVGLPVYEFSHGTRRFWYSPPMLGDTYLRPPPSVTLRLMGEGVPDVLPLKGPGAKPTLLIMIPVFCAFAALMFFRTKSWKVPAGIFSTMLLLEIFAGHLFSEQAAKKFWSKSLPFMDMVGPGLEEAGSRPLVPVDTPASAR